MKIAQLKPLFVATGIAMGLAFGSSAHALSPVFEVTPSGLGEPNGSFDADFINGASSELLHGDYNAGTLTANSGWLNFTGFSLTGNPVLPGTTGLGVNYQLYVTFDLVAQLASGTFGAANSSYNLTSLNYAVWIDTGMDSAFTQANAATSTEATVSAGATADTLLGGGSLISGVAGFDAQFGAFLNSLTTYGNTAAGALFFTEPVPFYNLAFNAFNNTAQGVIKNGGCTEEEPTCEISLTNAIGGVDFNQIPEPASLALLGIGLLGMGASLRKRKVA